jgi:hypothetical protein
MSGLSCAVAVGGFHAPKTAPAIFPNLEFLVTSDPPRRCPLIKNPRVPVAEAVPSTICRMIYLSDFIDSDDKVFLRSDSVIDTLPPSGRGPK